MCGTYQYFVVKLLLSLKEYHVEYKRIQVIILKVNNPYTILAINLKTNA